MNPYGPSIRHYYTASKNDIGLHYLNRGRPSIFFFEKLIFFFLMLSEWSVCKTLTPHYTHRPAQAQVWLKILSKKPKKCILTDFDWFWGIFNHFRAQRLHFKALYLFNILHPTLQLIFMADINQKSQNLKKQDSSFPFKECSSTKWLFLLVYLCWALLSFYNDLKLL